MAACVEDVLRCLSSKHRTGIIDQEGDRHVTIFKMIARYVAFRDRFLAVGQRRAILKHAAGGHEAGLAVASGRKQDETDFMRIVWTAHVGLPREIAARRVDCRLVFAR